MRDDFAWLKSNLIEHVAYTAPNATRLVVMLCMHLNRNSWTAEVSEETLAWELGIDPRSVRRQLGDLAERGLLSISRQGRCNVYRLALPSDYQPLLVQLKEARATPDIHVQNSGHGCPQSGDATPDIHVQNSGHGCPPNPYNNPLPPIFPQNTIDDDAHSAWPTFEAIWQFDMTDRREAARRAFDGLSAAERRLAVDRAPAYLRRCAESGTKRCRAGRWLREKGFGDESLLPPSLPQRLPSEPIVTERGYFIRISSPQWREWSRADGLLQAINTPRGVGCYKPSEWPPGAGAPVDAVAALAELP